MSESYGVVIRMFYNEYGPTHFHAEYGGTQAAIDFEGHVLRGSLFPRALRLVRAWAGIHGADLASNWDLARAGRPLALSHPSTRLTSVNELPMDRIPRVVSVAVRGPFSVLIEFDDGVSKRVDLRPLLKGPVFEPLQDPEEFGKVTVDCEAGTIVWPNQADIAPETLYLLPDERGAA